MNGTPGRRIEIFPPFNEALELTKRILFQPFDIGKWLVIGFAAFLAHLAGGGGGGGGNFNSLGKAPWKNGNLNWNYRSWSNDAYQSTDMSGCWLPLILGGAAVFFIILVVCLWIGSRGKFIFTDCIVRNRAAIVEPWHEYRREGNSYFFFTLVLGLAMMVVVGLATIPIWMPFALHGATPAGPLFVMTLIALGCIFVVVAIFIAVATSFMVPIMYRRRCSALTAFHAAVDMIMAEPGPVILYVLFLVVLWMAAAMVSCVASCVTCCIAAVPYVGTVILLPIYVFLTSYVLLFVRQFGPDYDAFANLSATAPVIADAAVAPPTTEPPPTEPPAPPPIQS